MILDYARFQLKNKRRKQRRIIILLFFILALLGATYLFLSEIVFQKPLYNFIFPTEDKKNLQDLWQEYLRALATIENKPQNLEAGLSFLEEIIKLSTQDLAKEPLNPEALLYNGYALFQRGLYEDEYEATLNYYDQALWSLRRAMLIVPTSLKAQLAYLIGKIYFAKRDFYYELSLKYLEMAFNLGYKEVDIYEHQYMIYEAWGESAKAVAVLAKAYEQKKSDIYLFFLARSLKKLKHYSDAKEKLQALLAKTIEGPLLREARLLLGEVAFEEGDLVLTEGIYRALLADDANLAEAHFRLALVLEKKGDYVGYRYELRRTLENDPGHSGARSRL